MGRRAGPDAPRHQRDHRVGHLGTRGARRPTRGRARQLDAAVELHYLDVPTDELWRREQARNMEDPPMERVALDKACRELSAPPTMTRCRCSTCRRISHAAPETTKRTQHLGAFMGLLGWADRKSPRLNS